MAKLGNNSEFVEQLLSWNRKKVVVEFYFYLINLVLIHYSYHSFVTLFVYYIDRVRDTEDKKGAHTSGLRKQKQRDEEEEKFVRGRRSSQVVL